MTSTSKNLVIAGVVIVALLFSLSPYLGKGRYQLGQSSNNSSTWKLDTVTGQVWGCGVAAGGSGCGKVNNTD
jgi:hypothetical protein|tara:strand:+ start:154 stop:369 length:216 start_codon:yes stop_codon:yes gene_type:complete